MSEPLFSVGEEVILQSRSYPEYNGDAVVLSVSDSSGAQSKGGEIRVRGGFMYRLTIESPVESRCWHEVAIKKKHKPSELSFDSLMSSLNQPIKREDLIKNSN